VAKRLTDKGISKLKKRERSYTIWDAKQTGLGIRVLPSGKKSWRLQLRYPGRTSQSKRTLGYFPTKLGAAGMTVARARTKAAEYYGLVKAGRDPKDVEAERLQEAERQRRALALQNAKTFAAVAEKYISEHLAGQRRGKKAESEIRKYLVSEWAEKPVSAITPSDVRELIGKLKRHAPYQARNVFGHCRTLMKWAVFNDLLEVSPCASLEQRWVLSGAKIAPRQRALNDTELGAFWRAASRLGYPYGPFFNLLLLTGVRVSELSGARWSELHHEVRAAIRAAQKQKSAQAVNWSRRSDAAKLWVVPRERFKSDVEHRVPLSDAALDVLATVPRFTGGDLLFTTTNGAKPIHGLSKAKARLDAMMLRYLKALARLRGEDPDEVTLPPFILHDLRRVVRTNLSALDVPDHVSEMVLGHARKGLQRIYDQHKYEPQIRDALVRWAERLRSLVTPAPTPPANVVKLRRKTK
jgi:integrase